MHVNTYDVSRKPCQVERQGLQRIKILRGFEERGKIQLFCFVLTSIPLTDDNAIVLRSTLLFFPISSLKPSVEILKSTQFGITSNRL